MPNPRSLALLILLASPLVHADPAAREWLDRVVASTGGASLYQGLQRMTIERDFHRPLDERDAGEKLSSQTLDNQLGQHLRITSEGQPPLTLSLSDGSVRRGDAAADEGAAEWMRGFHWRQWWTVVAEHAAGRLSDHQVTLAWRGRHDGRNVVRLRFTLPWGEAYLLEIDQRTALPVRRWFAFVDGEPTVVDSFHDFQDVDGFLMPHKVLSWSGGTLTEDIRYTRYEAETSGTPPDRDQRVRQVIAGTMMERRIPGLSVAVVHDGRLVFSDAMGRSSVELDVPATPDTVYPIASVSKVFAGLAAQRLAAEGRIKLDDNLSDFFDDLPPSVGAITIRQLLSHTHGLLDHYRSDAFKALPEAEREAMGPEDRLRWSAAQPPQFAPGAGWAYGLVGYEALGLVIERVSGQPYAEFVSANVLAPAGMTSAMYGGTEVVVPGRLPVTYEWTGERLVHHVVDFAPDTYTAGGLNASVLDMARLLLALEDGALLSQRHRDELWQAVPHTGEGEPFYALGWYSYRTRRSGRWVVGHEGGGLAWMNYYPEHRLGIVALSNLSGARADLLPYWIGDIFLEEEPPPSPED